MRRGARARAEATLPPERPGRRDDRALPRSASPAIGGLRGEAAARRVGPSHRSSRRVRPRCRWLDPGPSKRPMPACCFRSLLGPRSSSAPQLAGARWPPCALWQAALSAARPRGRRGPAGGRATAPPPSRAPAGRGSRGRPGIEGPPRQGRLSTSWRRSAAERGARAWARGQFGPLRLGASVTRRTAANRREDRRRSRGGREERRRRHCAIVSSPAMVHSIVRAAWRASCSDIERLVVMP
jgi:hypothetical protein